MGSEQVRRSREFSRALRALQDDESESSVPYEGDIQILKVRGETPTVPAWCCGRRAIIVCEKRVPNVFEHEEVEIADTSCTDNGIDVSQGTSEPQPLAIMKARQLLSWYTMSHNSNVGAVDDVPLPPLWVRCDMSDPAGTAWLGAEIVCVGDKVTGVKLYSVTCKGPTVDRKSLITLDDLKQEHKRRHPPSMVMNGSAQYNLFGATVVENTTLESKSRVTVDFKWSQVESILEMPPLSSSATLNIKISCGDMRSPIYQVYRELEFLQCLADGLRTGETEWAEPLETKSAVELVKAYLEELQNTTKTPQDQNATPTERAKSKPESDTSIFNAFMERGDLDFVEQLWVRMRKSVTSYQDVRDCLKLVIDALRYGDIKPWIHRDSSSSLSKLILQSYHQPVDHVALTGLTPVKMLLEMGLDKIRKDYINYLIGEELTTLNHLSFYLNTEVEEQEQVIRIKKLHHLLEIMVTSSMFLGLPYDRLFFLTQSCLQYYKTCPNDEEHEFTLQIKPALISHLFQKEHPVVWGVEVCSGASQREVRTSLQLSDKPLVDHITFETDDPNETLRYSEDPVYFTTMMCCSLVNF